MYDIYIYRYANPQYVKFIKKDWLLPHFIYVIPLDTPMDFIDGEIGTLRLQHNLLQQTST